MVFLTSMDVVDTGFLTVNNRTTQVTAANRVNSGSAVRLKGVEFELESSANLDKGVTPNNHNIIRDSKSEQHALISINPSTFKMTLVLNSKHTDTSNYYAVDDMANLALLYRLPHTRGWKAIYYPVDNSATDTGSNTSNRRDRQITSALGSVDTSASQGDLNLTLWTGTTSAGSKDLTDVNYLAVRFESCRINQTPTNKIQVVLTGVITS